ncbi:Dihydroorotate dehydrogenase (fumarate) [Datura stramonium]|uniref:Dihydroorotate dehydrogenase (Fumarate) n=1 Tax=Datura stramonium TaxID=4076 RepID=A0ABS8SM23_DATST|nr:Dihydroorotate dehydrogenase (fumarate) [Datura stramonium]
MKQRVGFALIRESLYRKLIKPNSATPRHYCTSSANVPPTPPPKVPHSSKKGRLLTGATIGLLIAGGAYASTVDEATFCGWLFSATNVNPFFAFLDPRGCSQTCSLCCSRGWVPGERGLIFLYWALMFGLLSLAPVTPFHRKKPKPRIFRLPSEGAIINRCGFNSEGIVAVAKRLGAQHGKRESWKHRTSSPTGDGSQAWRKAGPGILGVNLGKNKTSEDAAADYVQGVHTLSQYADYLVINISSPNTPGLRQLQGRKQLKDLVKKVQAARDEMQWGEEGPPPLLVKIAPDLSKQDLEDIAAVTLALRVGRTGTV